MAMHRFRLMTSRDSFLNPGDQVIAAPGQLDSMTQALDFSINCCGKNTS